MKEQENNSTVSYCQGGQGSKSAWSWKQISSFACTKLANWKEAAFAPALQTVLLQDKTFRDIQTFPSAYCLSPIDSTDRRVQTSHKNPFSASTCFEYGVGGKWILALLSRLEDKVTYWWPPFLFTRSENNTYWLLPMYSALGYICEKDIKTSLPQEEKSKSCS